MDSPSKPQIPQAFFVPSMHQPFRGGTVKHRVQSSTSRLPLPSTSGLDFPSISTLGSTSNGSLHRPPSSANTTITSEPTATPSWSKVLLENNMWSEQSNLSYVPPSVIDGKRVAVCPKESIQPKIERYKNALVGFALGISPSHQAMLRYV